MKMTDNKWEKLFVQEGIFLPSRKFLNQITSKKS